jgi:hypothetical protein
MPEKKHRPFDDLHRQRPAAHVEHPLNPLYLDVINDVRLAKHRRHAEASAKDSTRATFSTGDMSPIRDNGTLIRQPAIHAREGPQREPKPTTSNSDEPV